MTIDDETFRNTIDLAIRVSRKHFDMLSASPVRSKAKEDTRIIEG